MPFTVPVLHLEAAETLLSDGLTGHVGCSSARVPLLQQNQREHGADYLHVLLVGS